MKIKMYKITQLNIIALTTRFVLYGKMDNTYRLELNMPMIDKSITIYRAKIKPLFRNLYILSLLWLIFYFMLYPILLFSMLFFGIGVLLKNCKIEENDILDMISAILGFALIAAITYVVIRYT